MVNRVIVLLLFLRQLLYRRLNVALRSVILLLALVLAKAHSLCFTFINLLLLVLLDLIILLGGLLKVISQLLVHRMIQQVLNEVKTIL